MKTKAFIPLFLVALVLCSHRTLQAQSWLINGNGNTNVGTNFLGTTNNTGLAFRTNNLERMRLTGTGNLGIGLTTGFAGAKLQVANGSGLSLSAPGHFVLGLTSGYNLGFGVDAIQARNNGNVSTLYLNYYGGPTWIGNYPGFAIPSIYTAADGRVGIGTTGLTAGYALTVNTHTVRGGVDITDPGDQIALNCTKSGLNYGLYIAKTSTTSAAATIVATNAGSGEGVRAISTNGAGVSGYSTSSHGVYGETNSNQASGDYAGYFNGAVFASAGYFSSDENLKQNITDVSRAMGIIEQLRPKHYQFRQDGYYGQMHLPEGGHYGLLAQDVEKVLPSIVRNNRFQTRSPNPKTSKMETQHSQTIDFKALNYNELIPILIKGLQEQQEEIGELKREVDALRR